MTEFDLRTMHPDDSPFIRDLTLQGDGFMTTHFAMDAYQAMINFAELETVGVVATADGYDGLAGMATLRFGMCQFNGDLLPFAFLDSLKVDERHRKQGLGAQLAQWRVDHARDRFGNNVILMSGTTTDNVASQNTMKKWCREFTDPFRLIITTTRSGSPKLQHGITIREAQPSEYAPFATLQNTFYKDYNLYMPISAESLAQQVATSPTDQPMTQHMVAVRENGDLIAGVTVRNRGLLMYDHLNPPAPIRLAGRLLGIIPPDGNVRELQLTGMWFADGQESSIQPLLDTLRYQYYGKVNSLSLLMDKRNPLANLVKANRFIPTPQIIFSIRGHDMLDRNRLNYAIGRS